VLALGMAAQILASDLSGGPAGAVPRLRAGNQLDFGLAV